MLRGRHGSVSWGRAKYLTLRAISGLSGAENDYHSLRQTELSFKRRTNSKFHIKYLLDIGQ